MNVSNNEEAEELVKRCMEQFHITVSDIFYVILYELLVLMKICDRWSHS